MRFLTIISALVASSAIVAAAPAPEQQAPAACPNGWTYCGVWNIETFLVSSMQKI